MNFEVITLFPQFFSAFFARSMVAKSVRGGHCNYCIRNLRYYGLGKHSKVDDSPYGGNLQDITSPKGKGMLIRSDIVAAAIADVKKKNSLAHIIHLSPRGQLLTAAKARKLAKKPSIALLCGHYEGIDARVDTLIDEEISIGDYVTFSGEVAAQVLLEAVLRFVPGVLQENSSSSESFEDGLLESDQFTKPAVGNLGNVPNVLLSGNHALISSWSRKNALLRTYKNRPQLLLNAQLFNKELWFIAEYVENKHTYF